MIVVYLGWRLVDIYLGTGHNAKPASREIRDSCRRIKRTLLPLTTLPSNYLQKEHPEVQGICIKKYY